MNPANSDSKHCRNSGLPQASTGGRSTARKAFQGLAVLPPAAMRADARGRTCSAIDHSIHSNRAQGRSLPCLQPARPQMRMSADVDTLYPMLEGQVAALSSGAISSPEAACRVLESLYDSKIYRPDQHSFMLVSLIGSSRTSWRRIAFPLTTSVRSPCAAKNACRRKRTSDRAGRNGHVSFQCGYSATWVTSSLRLDELRGLVWRRTR